MPDRRPGAEGPAAVAAAALSRLLQALYRGDDARVADELAANTELDVFEAAAFGRAARLQMLLEDDASLANASRKTTSAVTEDGFQPLPLACFYGHLEAVRVLLDHGADLNTLARNEHIRTNALHAASASENKDEQTRYEL